MINYEIKEGVAVVTLARPERLNALIPEMSRALAPHFETAARDDRVRSVLLQAEGRAFCADGDVGRIANDPPYVNREVMKLSHRMIRNLAAIEKPVVASLRGSVAGIGWSLALACDIIIASETARFAQVFRNIGLVPDGGAVWFLTQYVGTLKAKELVFSGRRIDANEAMELGLVTRVVTDTSLTQRVGRPHWTSFRAPREPSARARRSSNSCTSPPSRRCWRGRRCCSRLLWKAKTTGRAFVPFSRSGHRNSSAPDAPIFFTFRRQP